jgi:hypothetical protein
MQSLTGTIYVSCVSKGNRVSEHSARLALFLSLGVLAGSQVATRFTKSYLRGYPVCRRAR